MFKRLISIAAIAGLAFSATAALAQGQPPAWKYGWENGIATATYPGIIKTGSPAVPIEIAAVDFGANCDGPTGTDNAAAITTAVTYAAAHTPAVVKLPGGALCRVNSTITIPGGVGIEGTGFASTSGLAAGATNLTLLSLTGNSSSVRNLSIIMNAAGTNTSGVAISMGITSYSVIENVYTEGSCDALRVNGSLHKISNNYFNLVRGAACNAVTVGNLTTLGNSIANVFDHVTVACNQSFPADAGWVFSDAGGNFIRSSDAIFCTTGTKLIPGANQQVIWNTFTGTMLGDTNASTTLVIDTAAASAQVKGNSFEQAWASSSVAGGTVVIGNTAGGVVKGLYFDGLRAFGSSGNTFTVSGTPELSVSNSFICGYAGAGFNLLASASNIRITDTVIQPNCANQTSTGTIGVNFNGTNADIVLEGNDTAGNSTQAAGVPTGNSIVKNNRTTSNLFQVVASAGTTALTSISDNWTITGTTAVTNLTGAWNGRTVQIVTPDGVVAFNSGGNICTSVSSVQNRPLIATFQSTFGCWIIN